MTMLLGAWLILILCMAIVTLFAVWSRRPTYARPLAVLALLVAAPVSFWAIQTALGLPDTNPPPGRYKVLGARIDVDEAIYVLLDGAGEPVYYRLPYSVTDANDLQEAIDIADGSGGDPAMDVGDGGDAAFHPPPVTEDEPKQSEAPAYSVE